MSTEPTHPSHIQVDSCEPSSAGILGCLRMLAAEAGSLHLPHTVQALLDAINTCVSERPAAVLMPPAH